MKVRLICPNGARLVRQGDVWVEVAAGAVHDFPDELAKGLLEQPDVWAPVKDKPAKDDGGAA